MANLSEMQSLETIQYKSKLKFYLYPVLVIFLFVVAFMNFYPIGEKLKSFLKTNLAGSGCNPNYSEVHMEWLLPKLVISDLTLSPGCLGQESGESLNFNFVKVNFNLISFSPFGLPFKIDTEMNGQPLTLYFVQGFGERMLRLKDQKIALTRLAPLLGKDIKIAGNITLDLSLLMTNSNALKNLTFRAQSKDFQLPSQSIQGFTTPNLKLNDLFIEALSDAPPRITIGKMILGDPDSPIRANFSGNIDLQQDAPAFSPLNLKGEVAFSDNLKETLPLIDMMFQSFTQKDRFYQIAIGGTLGAPQPTSL